MALTEKLQLIIDADGKGAVRGLESVGAAADRNLGKTDDRLTRVGAQLTSFGTATVAAAAVAGAGLYKVAQDASAYGEQVSRATKVFGDEAVPDLEDFADAAAETAGISKTAALTAASNFAAFGKQAGLTGKDLAGFSEQMVQSAGDFASLNDIPVDEAILAFGSALSGEAEPLKRFGIDISDAAVQAYALENGIGGATGAATQSEKVMARYGILMQEGALWAGDFADTSDSLGNRQKKLAADFENVKVELGNGLLPIAESGIGIVQSLADSFSNMGDAQQSSLGSLAGWAVIGAGAIGTLSLLGGQAIKLRNILSDVGADGERSLNKLGRGAKYAGLAFGSLLAADFILDWANNVTGATDRVSQAITDLSTNVNQSTGNITQDFTDLVAAQGDVNSLAGIWEGFGRVFEFEGENMKYTIEDVDRAFDELLESSPAAADAVVKDFKRQADAAEEGSQKQKDYSELYERHKDKVQEKKDADIAAAKAQSEYNQEIGEAAGLFDDAASSTEDATSALQEYSDTLTGMLDPQFAAVDAMQGLHDAQIDVVKATADVNKLQAEGKTGTAEYGDALTALEEAQFGAVKAAYDQEQALLDLAISMDESGDSTEDVVASLRKYGEQAGLTVDETNAIIAEFLTATGAAKELGAQNPKPTADADTQPFWSAMFPAKREADSFGGRWDRATIAANAAPYWAEANRVKSNVYPTQWVQIRPNFVDAPRPGWWPGQPGTHGGGLVATGKGYLVGEQGPEYFQPSTAGTIIPNHDLGNHMGGGRGGGGSVYNINVTAGMANPAETGRAVVDAIRSYERVNGQGWRN